MLKRKLFKRICIIISTILSILLILLFPKDNDINYEVGNINVTTPIYLLNKDNILSRLTMYYDSTNDIDLVYEILSLLTIDSADKYRIRDGFKGIIPKGTRVLDVIKDDNIIYIDFSNEFLNISPNYEDKLIEAIVYSILSNIDGVKLSLMVESNKIVKFPHSNKILPEYLDKSIKINKKYNLNSLNDITYTTIYYPASDDEYNYYIPVTNITNSKDEKIEIIIDELKSSSTYNTNMISYINEETELINYEIMNDSILLNFNNAIFDLESNKLIEEVTYSINLSIKDNYNVSSVMYMIDNEIINNYFLLLG